MNNFVDPEDDGDQNLPQLTSLTNSVAPPHRTNHPTVTTTSQQQQLPNMAPFTHLSSSSNHYHHHAFTNSQDQKSSGSGVSPRPQFHEKGRRRSSSGIATTTGGGDCETSLATNEDTSFSFGVTTANDVTTALSSVVGDNENSPLTLTTAVSSSVVDHRRHSGDLLSSNASLRDANPQTPNFVVAVVSSPPQPAGRIPGGGPPLARPVQLPPSGAPRSSMASTTTLLLNPIARLSSKQSQQYDDEDVQTELVGSAAPINRETTIGPSDDELVQSNQVQSMSSCSPPPPPAQGSSPNNHNNNNKMDDDDEDEEPSYDDVDICFPSMGGDDAAADDTMMFLPTVGSSDDRLLCESTSNEPPLPRPPTGATTTIAAPTTSSSSMKIPIGKSPRRHHSEDDFSPIPPQGDNDNDNEQQIVVSVGSHPSSTKRSGGGGFFQEVPPRRSTSSTSQQQQSSPQQSLWRNLTDHLEPSLRHLSSSSLNDSLGLATASYSQHGSPLGGTSRAAAAAVASTGGSRPYLTLHHLHTHGLLDGSAIPSRSSSMSAESFEDPPLAMSPRYYGSDDDDGNSSRAGSSVAYGLCGGSSHSSLFEHTPQEFQSIGTTSTPPLSPPVMMSSVSPRTTRLLRGGPGFGSLGTPGANSGARYGHIPHASTMFPSDSPLDLDKRN